MGKALTYFFSGNLRRRLLFSVAAIHAVMMSVFIWDLTERQQDMILSQQTRLATALAQSVATSTAIWLQARDVAGLQEIIESQKRYPELSFGMVVTADGEILAHTDQSLRGRYLTDLPARPEQHLFRQDESLVDVATPALVAGQHVGWVRIGVGKGVTHSELAALTRDGVFYTLFAILVGSLLAALLARQMTRRLNIIQSTADAVQAGESGRRANVAGDDEAAILARQFNRMLDTLEEREQELEQHRSHLEETVAERTTDLASKNKLFESISRMQAQFIREQDPQELFSCIVQEFAALTDSEMGFVGDIHRHEDGYNYLKDYSFFNVPQDEASQHFYEKHKATGFMFRQDQHPNLFNQVITDRTVIIANAPARGSHSTGLPDGHPPLQNFLGIPVFYGERLVGEIGLANRTGGYNRAVVDMLKPVIDACGRIIVARWDQSAREEAEAAAIEAQKTAESANEAKSMFLANMSHELRTPLNAILGMLYLALRNDLPDALRNQLSKARSSAHSLLSIINDILDLSKIEAGKLEIEKIEFGLDGVLERVTDIVAGQAADKNIEFLIRYDNEIPCTLVGDPLRLGQVLINLCGNAVKFTEVGQVELSFHADEVTDTTLTARICVMDSGLGMSTDLQAQLFEKFVQADQSSTRRFGGTGLGLAISRMLVEMMGGRIWVEHSEPGSGTTFCLSLPLGIASQARRSHREDVVKRVGHMLKGKRVLVVDDNEVSLEILAEMMRDFQFEVDVEPSGAAALARVEIAGDGYYDVVLTDWSMPGMNGDEVVRKLRRNATMTSLPKFIIVTAYGREDVLEDAERAGADGFLVKPVSPSALLDTTLEVLGRERLWDTTSEPVSLRKTSKGYNFSGMRLLLVEDNEINREFAGILLRSEDIEVDEAINGLEAISRVQEKTYDGVLMDVQMPVMDGLEATRQIRALANNPGQEYFASLPIIAMTALAMEKDIERTRDAGMNDHVTKPVEPEQLMATLAKWVKHKEQKRSISQTFEPPEDMKALINLDVKGGIHRIGGNANAYRKQLKRFSKNYADCTTELQRFIDKEGTQQAEGYCHALKGVTGNIGAKKLHEKVTELDDLLKQNQIPEKTALNEMEVLLQAVLSDIESLLETSDTSMSVDCEPLKAIELHNLLQKLLNALETDLGAVETLVIKLQHGLTDSDQKAAIEAIARQIDCFDTDTAIDLINQFQSELNITN
ncbi:MAG: response regulator [Gammaproteobacteria bacterium]|nr:response regulator [Gammaproteobacteria bacterium]